jgi:hypothetical protein
MSEFRGAGGFARPEPPPLPPVDVRASVAKAIEAELARVPARTRAFLGLNDIDRVVDSVISGEGDERSRLASLMQIGDPDYKPQDDGERFLQDQMLKGYTSEGWTPDQKTELGRDPESMEYSPGAKMLADIKARQRLVSRASGESLGPFGPSNSAREYNESLDRTHAPLSLESLNSPETTIGSYMTKMGPVMSDGWSQLATALLSDGEKARDSAGNAAVRSYGADWNRVSPQLKQFTDWRSAHGQIKEMRGAYNDSTGMDSADTLRAATGIKPSWYTRPVEWAMSLGNGLLDGSFGAGVGKGAARAIGQELMEEAVTDGGISTAVMLATPPEYRAAKENESDTEFAERQKQESARRQQAIKQLESGNDQIVRPQTMFQKYAAKPFGNLIGGLLD